MKIRELKREPYFTIEFDRSIPFTEDNESHEGIFTLKELNTLGDWIAAVLQDHGRSISVDNDLLVFPSDDPTNVDTDPPDEYNVYSDKNGHDCKATVDGG
jgi:hypothetical protein